MSEASFWALIRNHLHLKMYRVENKVAIGMPDIHYVFGKGSGWIELKYMDELPAKGKLKIGLRKSQAIWHRIYNNFGGKSWILIRICRIGIILVDGNYSDEIAKMPSIKNLIEVSSWNYFGNMRNENWTELRDVIQNQD